MPKTYNDLYLATRTALKNAGVEAYALEARLLVAYAVGKTKEKIRTIGIAPLKTHAYFVAQTITARHNRRILRLFQFPSRLNTLRTAIFVEFLRRFIGNIGGIIHTALKLRLTYRNVCHGL